jgi:hypothetical protein
VQPSVSKASRKMAAYQTPIDAARVDSLGFVVARLAQAVSLAQTRGSGIFGRTLFQVETTVNRAN